jgi:hypothetical protein
MLPSSSLPCRQTERAKHAEDAGGQFPSHSASKPIKEMGEWQQWHDPKSNRHYWHNIATKITQWAAPQQTRLVAAADGRLRSDFVQETATGSTQETNNDMHNNALLQDIVMAEVL